MTMTNDLVRRRLPKLYCNSEEERLISLRARAEIEELTIRQTRNGAPGTYYVIHNFSLAIVMRDATLDHIHLYLKEIERNRAPLPPTYEGLSLL